MSPLVAGVLARAADPSPNPTEGALRPGLETWEVSPGLVGFLVTFVLALACVVLFLNMSKHLRKAGHNARQQGLPIAEPEGIGFRRTDGEAEFGPGAPAESPAAAADTGSADSPAAGERGGSGG